MDAHATIIRFCNYQERSHQEVRDKLYSLGLHRDEVEASISELIEQNLLNEERFALAYARGKFRIKHWGKVKIIQGLKRHRISQYLIQKAMSEIDPSSYFETAYQLAEKKWKNLGEKGNAKIRQMKLRNYLLQKGFESSIIAELMTDLLSRE